MCKRGAGGTALLWRFCWRKDWLEIERDTSPLKVDQALAMVLRNVMLGVLTDREFTKPWFSDFRHFDAMVMFLRRSGGRFW